MDIRHLTEDDVVEAANVFVTSLGSAPPKKPERFQRYWDVEGSLGAFDDDGRVLGVAARFSSRFTVPGGGALPCTAVPSVGVRADAHGQGIGRALLERQVAEAQARGDALMALNASEVWIYGRFGYGATSPWWSVKADPRNLTWRPDAPRAAPGSVRELSLAEAADVLPGLYDRAYGGWGGELWRPADMWAVTFDPRPDVPRPLVAVHHDADGVPDAATMFTVKQAFDDIGFANKVDIIDLFGIDPAAEALLARWLCERNLVGKVTAERCSPLSPIGWMLEDPRRWRTTVRADAAWVRVLDVPRVLSARTSSGDGAVRVRVLDPLVAANDGIWRVGAADGHLTCEATNDPPEITVGIDLLASMAWGYEVPSTLVAAGRATAHTPDAARRLDGLLSVAQPSWCSTAF